MMKGFEMRRRPSFPWKPERFACIFPVVCFFAAVISVSGFVGLAFAQGHSLSSDVPTLQEKEILDLASKYSHVSILGFDSVFDKEHKTYLRDYGIKFEHYVRDGCKKKLSGDWIITDLGAIVNITYDENYKVFIGRLKQKGNLDYLKQNHQLFKVYFPAQVGHSLDAGINIETLRMEKKCIGRTFTGKEFAYDPSTKKNTVSNLVLTLQDNKLIYQVENQVLTLIRLER